MLSVCCVTDDKPGHKSQLDGLLAALKRHAQVREQWFHLASPSEIEAPVDLIICAGRTTHLPALRLKRKLRSKAVALSKSWIPRRCFDLNIIPAHDGVPEGARVFNTIGAMNAIMPSVTQDLKQGLILIGGPSANHGWDSKAMLGQVKRLIACASDLNWTLTTSRRTPAEFIKELQALDDIDRLKMVPFEETDREWLLRQYQTCGVIWVSEDSVSMICESLASGAIVGALVVPRKKQGRVSGNLDQMIESGRVVTLASVEHSGLPETAKFPPLQEAEKAAIRLIDWLQ